MSETTDKLSEMASNDTNKQKSYSDAKKGNQDRITELESQQEAMKTGVADIASEKIKEYLKRVYPEPDYEFYEDPTYNKVMDSTGSVTHWVILSRKLDNTSLTLPHFTQTSSTLIRCSGDKTTLFTMHPDQAADIGFAKYSTEVGEIYSNVCAGRMSDVYYDSTASTWVTFDIEQGHIDPTSDVCFLFYIDYNTLPISHKEKIITYVNDWNFVWDYINKVPDKDGTYGTKMQIENLRKSSDSMTSNENKYGETKDRFRKYIQNG